MKINFIDRLKILNVGTIRVDAYVSAIEDKLVQYFSNTKYLYSRTNVFGQLLNVVRDISNILFYYHNTAVQESNILTAQKEISIRHFAEMSGVRVTRAISSSGVIKLSIKPTFFANFGSPVYIRKNAILSNTENSILYLANFNSSQIIINQSHNNIYIPVIQGSIKNATFIADGSKLFSCALSDTDIIEESHIAVTVNNEVFTRKDSLFDLLYGEKSYFIKTGYLSQYEIIFGNGVNGYSLNSGDSINIEYITSVGSSGNFDENIYPEFSFVSGVFNNVGEGIEINEHVTAVKQQGFIDGSDGDSVDSLRKIIGYNSRANVLVDARSLYAYLSRYSFISRISIWTNETNRKINNILLLPNIAESLNNVDEYLYKPISELSLSEQSKNAIINNILTNELSYMTNELVWVDPVFRQYAVMVYLEPLVSFASNSEIYSQIKEELISLFVNTSFSRNPQYQDISKSVAISGIQSIVGNDCRVSLIFISQQNEEAKINGFYNKVVTENGKTTTKRIDVQFGTDPMIGLNDRNDIDTHEPYEVPILRGGFEMISTTGDIINVYESINLYVNNSGNWTKID